MVDIINELVCLIIPMIGLILLVGGAFCYNLIGAIAVRKTVKKLGYGPKKFTRSKTPIWPDDYYADKYSGTIKPELMEKVANWDAQFDEFKKESKKWYKLDIILILIGAVILAVSYFYIGSPACKL